MPNRILREGIIDSDRVDQLSWAAECFYRRLHSLVDDYGCFDGRLSILKSKLYPTEKKQAVVSLPDIGKWLKESEAAGLVRCYESQGKPYIVVLDFNQTVRIKKRKFPAPPDEIMNSTCDADATHVQSIRLPETKPDLNPDLNPNPEPNRSEREQRPPAHDEKKVKNSLFVYLTKNVKEFYPQELSRINSDLEKFCKSGDPKTEAQIAAEDTRLIKKYLESTMVEEIKKCWNYYSSRNFKIDGEPIIQWKPVLAGWMGRRGNFKKAS